MIVFSRWKSFIAMCRKAGLVSIILTVCLLLVNFELLPKYSDSGWFTCKHSFVCNAYDFGLMSILQVRDIPAPSNTNKGNGTIT